tara:strand:- start:347 stop:829 length:483 start_codon:yes stop_codon:yes gene_type:complete
MYVAAGGSCDTLTPRDTFAEASGDCDGGALLSVYRTDAGVYGAIAAMEGLQDTNPSPHVIAAGYDWIVAGDDAGSYADAMGGEAVQIGVPGSEEPTALDLTTDAGLCAADAELTNLELNDAIAPLLGLPSDRDDRTAADDDEIREYKNAAFLRECPERAG